ncbi:unnamed protein product [Microthlaspi erraticum]|uniref:Uncharacterized protein n=1 Tax=Microthlaspi erraticum TaxID=1685480 RepID=A0A6D2KV28_9BRAS|nr:unnamed protein product [Microthlaspi erraticum]CAA7052943.1 unnamed protein product [Microthlaspi erraticum]CAA7057207.1 unnamed protein product [Microthlaspi erraticum]
MSSYPMTASTSRSPATVSTSSSQATTLTSSFPSNDPNIKLPSDDLSVEFPNNELRMALSFFGGYVDNLSRDDLLVLPIAADKAFSHAGLRYYLCRAQTPNAIRRCRSTLSSTRRTTGGQLLMVGLCQTLIKGPTQTTPRPNSTPKGQRKKTKDEGRRLSHITIRLLEMP